MMQVDWGGGSLLISFGEIIKAKEKLSNSEVARRHEEYIPLRCESISLSHTHIHLSKCLSIIIIFASLKI